MLNDSLNKPSLDSASKGKGQGEVSCAIYASNF